MKIFGWLFRHTILILVIIAVIYGYMFWGNLLGDDTPAGKAVAYLSDEFVEVEDFVAAVKAKQAKLNQNDVSGQASAEQLLAEQQLSASSEQSVNSMVNEDYAENNGNIEQQPVIISQNQTNDEQESNDDLEQQGETSTEAGNVAVIEDNGATVTDNAATTVAIANDVKETFVSVEIAKQLDNVDDSGKVIDKTLRGDALRMRWITARKSFYQRNYALSEQSYQQVIGNTEDNFDAYGELGNVYFNQGKNKQAASAYYEAAAIFVKKGQFGRARSLMGLLQGLDKSRAEELRKLIDLSVS